MRIWSLHPRYLDAKGLVALWRETLLAKHVLEGKTKGYRMHPQLDRFKALKKGDEAINKYLLAVYEEAGRRNYHFDRSKIGNINARVKIEVTNGQVEFEWKHLMNKLKVRDQARYKTLQHEKEISLHPVFGSSI